MLRKVMTAMMTGDRALVDQVSRMDNGVDGLYEGIKLYIATLTRGSLGEREGRPETLETTSLHLDVLRDLRRIYPVLDASGELAAYRGSESSQFALTAAQPR
jgi:phosphate:Na+ symporter